jgi:protein-S-isoprenylcysteine O-methyltransferase Ste14
VQLSAEFVRRPSEPSSAVKDHIFQVLTGASLIAFAAIWGVNLLRVGISRDVFFSKREGVAFALVSKVLLAASIVGLVAYLGDPASMTWSQLAMPAWLRFFGLPVAGLGIGLLAWAFHSLGRHFSTTLVIKEGHTLVTSGPYHWVRHPMYAALSLTFGGFFLLSANWFVGGTAALVYGAVMVVRTPEEERMLLQQFGDEYRSYTERTGRFLPKASRLTR